MSGKFFTFPLCVLAMPLGEKDVLQHMVAEGILRAGEGDGAKEIKPEQIREYLAKHEKTGYSKHTDLHEEVVRGAIVTDVVLGWISGTIKNRAAVQAFALEHQQKHGPGPLVFVASELLWSCNNDDGFSFREFSTLCAINSVVGFKRIPVVIRRSMIIARQLGYKTPAVMAAELAAQPNHRKPLSVQQLRDTLDKLEKRDLFRRVQPGRRTVYFSTTLNRTELIAAVQEKVASKDRIQQLRQKDRELFAKPKVGQ